MLSDKCKYLIFFLLCVLFFEGNAEEIRLYSLPSTTVTKQWKDTEMKLINPQIEETKQGDTIYADSICISTDHGKGTPYNGWLWICISLLIGAISVLWFLYQKESAKKSAIQKAEKQAYDSSPLKLYLIHTSIYKDMAQLIQLHQKEVNNRELLSEEKWEELFAAINAMSNGFTERLKQAHPNLKAEDIRFCCLIKAGFKYSDIACLLGRTPNMMYKRRDTVMKRMSYQEEVKDLGEYLKNF